MDEVIELKRKIARLQNSLVRTIKGKVMRTPYNLQVEEQISDLKSKLDELQDESN